MGWPECVDPATGNDLPQKKPARRALAELRRVGSIEGPNGDEIDTAFAISVRDEWGRSTYIQLRDCLKTKLLESGGGRLSRFACSERFDEAVAVVAATLARVRENDTRPVARQLGAKSRDEAPLMAEARFKRLIRTTTAPDLLEQGRRIVMLLGRTASVGDLGASLLLWNVDPYAKRRWSFAYYGVDDVRADDPDDDTTGEATTSPAA